MKISPPQVWRNKRFMYKLTASKCESCGHVNFPYSSYCAKCGSKNVKKIEISGKGILESYTVSYQSRDGHEKGLPSVIGLVRLDEGVEIVAPIVDADLDKLKEGVKVEATLRRVYTDSYNGLIQYGIKFRVAEG
ncbi:DNA-binding protein [Sulfolobus sp. E5-1-F]|uniref:Zn-ribbon domain-containing OB-fold protein n=1 Tax=Sulfolobaceae TaxID=118883 RepID=UPI0012949B85|nr:MULTISPECIES: Zn-ribbon domain-containing OB-fold protein [unclassified Sulfolobus]QGA54700.1 DNA-binding protein [Sulfolobus sp. E5-1-F]QGA67552.1 DNA-binding protein [Sulfolobus sp. E11-6]